MGLPDQSPSGRVGVLCLNQNGHRLFSTHPRNDRTPPPPPSLRGSSRELTAGTPELDVLLTVHLQVCKALLQVAEGPGGAGVRVERGGSLGGPGRWLGVLSAKG